MNFPPVLASVGPFVYPLNNINNNNEMKIVLQLRIAGK